MQLKDPLLEGINLILEYGLPKYIPVVGNISVKNGPVCLGAWEKRTACEAFGLDYGTNWE